MIQRNTTSSKTESAVLPPSSALTRRRFLAGAGASAISLTVLKPELARGTEANARVNLGLIGCGNRGAWIAGLFQKHGGYNITAVADYFPDKADAAGEKFHIPTGQRFTGLSCHRRLLEAKVDAVAIESPPYFHARQAAEAVEAGKHVYLAKPIAVDVPGCNTVAESGRKATAKKLVCLIDFQTRATAAYQEVVQRVHDGQIGPIKSAEASYMCDQMFGPVDEQFRKSNKDATAQLRAWTISHVLSGDVITEQNIHVLDVASWFIGAAPLKAVGAGGKARDYLGDAWDHFAVIYTFPNDVLLTFSSRQFGTAYSDLMCRIYGASGTADTHYGGRIFLRGMDEFFDATTPDIYAGGAINNIATFYKSITEGNYSNPTVAPSVRSTLITILGRAAAYTRREVTWDEMMRANDKWEFDTTGLRI